MSHRKWYLNVPPVRYFSNISWVTTFGAGVPPERRVSTPRSSKQNQAGNGAWCPGEPQAVILAPSGAVDLCVGVGGVGCSNTNERPRFGSHDSHYRQARLHAMLAKLGILMMDRKPVPSVQMGRMTAIVGKSTRAVFSGKVKQGSSTRRLKWRFQLSGFRRGAKRCSKRCMECFLICPARRG